MATTETPAAPPLTEPYVGPRPFERGESDRFFGRDREVRRLLSLVVAHRVVLLYAASGAGKTSLLSAGLVPELESGEEFEVLPIARVQGADADEPGSSTSNAYARGVLSNWDAPDQTLAAFLAGRERKLVDGLAAPRSIVIDQLEEVFTLYPEQWKQRPAFFDQLAAALAADASLRVVLAIREDYLAQLDPFAHLLGGLRTRFRLEPLRYEAALLAVTEPLADTPRSFADGVAERLVDDLQRIRVETASGASAEIAGEFVEPVQLQVACHSLWQALPPGIRQIRMEHLETFGDVDQVLARYYGEAVAEAAGKAQLAELDLRDRLEQAFITPAGTRGTAHAEEHATADIPATAIRALEDRHLLRAERTRGARWYELTHDRLIEPIRASNRQARQERDRHRRRSLMRVILALAILAAIAGAVAFVALDRADRGAGPQAVAPVRTPSMLTILDHGGPVDMAAFSPSGGLVVTAGADGTAQVWDVQSSQNLARLSGDGSPILSATFDRAGERLVTTSARGEIRIWDWKRLEALLRRSGPAAANRPGVSSVLAESELPVRDADFSPDGRLILTAEGELEREGQPAPLGRARLYDVAARRVLRTFPHRAPIASVAFHPTEHRIVSAGGDRAQVWNWDTGRPTAPPIVHPDVNAASFSPDGRLILTAGGSLIETWTRDGVGELSIEGVSRVLDASFSRDGRYIVSGHADANAEIFDLDDAAANAPLSGHGGQVTSASFSSDGKLVVTSSNDGTARIWSPTGDLDAIDAIGDLDVVRPLATPVPRRSEFSLPDAGGAPAVDGTRYHGGLDWFAPAGSAVRAPVDGRVVEAKRSRAATGSAFGGTVKLEAEDGKVWVFRSTDPTVRLGDEVAAGDKIGAVSLWEDGPEHVHIEVWKTLSGGFRYENLIDPLVFFRKAAD